MAEYNILDPAHEFTFNITAAVSIAYRLYQPIPEDCTIVLMHAYPSDLAPHLQPAFQFESHLRDPRPTTRQHEPEDRHLDHGRTNIDRTGRTLCDLLSDQQADDHLAAAVRRQHRRGRRELGNSCHVFQAVQHPAVFLKWKDQR